MVGGGDWCGAVEGRGSGANASVRDLEMPVPHRSGVLTNEKPTTLRHVAGFQLLRVGLQVGFERAVIDHEQDPNADREVDQVLIQWLVEHRVPHHG